MITRQLILSKLPAPKLQKVVTVSEHKTSDIINQMIIEHADNKKFAGYISQYFKGRSSTDTCKNIYDFLRTQFHYVVEPAKDQTTKSLPAFMKLGYGDCKHYAGLFGIILEDLKIPFVYRFVSFDKRNSNPTHVYVVALNEQNKPIYCDACLPLFNVQKQYTGKPFDKIPNTMALSRISGVEQDEHLGDIGGYSYFQTPFKKIYRARKNFIGSLDENPAVEFLSYVGEIDGEEIYTDAVGSWFSKAAGKIKQAAKATGGAIKQAVKATGGAVKQAAQFTGKEIKQGAKFVAENVKKVGLSIPRQVFLGLVSENIHHFGTDINNAFKKDSNSISNMWRTLGGDPAALRRAASDGSKKHAIFGPQYQIGFEPATTATALATSAPVIAIAVPVIKKILGNTSNVDPNVVAAAAQGFQDTTGQSLSQTPFAQQPDSGVEPMKSSGIFDTVTNVFHKAEKLIPAGSEAVQKAESLFTSHGTAPVVSDHSNQYQPQKSLEGRLTTSADMVPHPDVTDQTDTTKTVLVIGGIIVGGIILFKVLN